MNKLTLYTLTSALVLHCSGCDNSSVLQPLTPAQLPPSPQTVAISISNYSPAPGNMFKNIFVSNFSQITSRGQSYLSSAKDGLTDNFKNTLGSSFNFSLTSPYTGTSGYNNLLLYLTSTPVIQLSNLYCGSSGVVSSICTVLNGSPNNCANDALIYTPAPAPSPTPPPSPVFFGLSDCEKEYANLNVNVFDSNGNGVPDYLKFRCGLNPYNTSDGNASISNDSLSTIEKCKRHLPPDENSNSQLNLIYAYQYVTSANSNGTTNFNVNNITVMNGGQDNFLAIYVVETNLTSQAEALSSAYILLNPSVVGTGPILIPYWGLKTNVNIPIGSG